jgi:hypothetical protein
LLEWNGKYDGRFGLCDIKDTFLVTLIKFVNIGNPSFSRKNGFMGNI